MPQKPTCAPDPYILPSLDVPIKMFANSLAVLNQQTLGRTDHAHCFQTQFTESCLVTWLSRLDSGLMVSRTDLKFTFHSKILLSL